MLLSVCSCIVTVAAPPYRYESYLVPFCCNSYPTVLWCLIICSTIPLRMLSLLCICSGCPTIQVWKLSFTVCIIVESVPPIRRESCGFLCWLRRYERCGLLCCHSVCPPMQVWNLWFTVLLQWLAHQQKMDMVMLRNSQGIHAPMRLHMEQHFARKASHIHSDHLLNHSVNHWIILWTTWSFCDFLKQFVKYWIILWFLDLGCCLVLDIFGWLWKNLPWHTDLWQA